MFEILLNHYPAMLEGLVITVQVSFWSIGIGMVLGLVLTLGLTSPHRWVRWPCGLYRSFWRGTPILLQLLLVYYLLPDVGIEVAPMTAAIMTLAMNTAAFQAEIFRSGLNHIPPGQTEAGRMLGMRMWSIRRRVLMPQVLRTVLPPLTNEVITIVKNSTLVSVIAVTELLRVSDQIVSRTFKPLETYLAAALLFLLLNMVLSRLSALMERRLSTGAVTE